MDKKTLYWLQGGGCGGDSMALLNVESPNILEVLEASRIEVLWHPSLSNISHTEHKQLIENIQSGKQALDILCVEGNVIRGPAGTGMFDTFDRKPKKNLIAGLARQAQFVIAVGTCASFGGIGSDIDDEIEATGLQYHKKYDKDGFLGREFTAKSGERVINLPGCPCHPEIVAGVLATLGSDTPLSLNKDYYNTPDEWYSILVHQGCSRNECHEYRIEDRDFGGRGCLFFHLGCRGPLTHAPCNTLLWNNRRSSKTRVGSPCVGCTTPDFPGEREYAFFETRSIMDIPVVLPEGVDRAHYIAYKDMAAAAAPDRLKEKK